MGVLVGSILARINGISFIKRQEFNKAAAEFRAVFVDLIYDVNHTKITDGDSGWYAVRQKINTGEFFKLHEKAKILFEFHISDGDRRSFSDAWGNYSQWTDNFKNQNDDKDKRSEILDHIYRLLEYAKSK
jgi:hypothetical protein